MAFCSKCGTQMEDNAAFCPSCGATNEKAAKAQSAAGNDNQPKDKTSVKNLAVIAGVAVVVVVVIVLLAKLLGGGYEKPIKSLVKAMNKASYELEDYTDSTNKIFSNLIEDAFDLVDDIDGDIMDDLEDAIAETFEDAYDELEDYYGKNIKITYEVEDEEEIDEDELEEMEESLIELSETIKDEKLSDADELMDMVEDMLDTYGMEDALEDIVTEKNIKKVAKFLKAIEKEFGKVRITKGYNITVDVEIEGEDDDEKFKDVTLTVLKINGKWGIEPSSLMNFVDTVIGLDVESVAEDVLYSIIGDLMG